jgi:glycosyltransferase involved in cell wall biosynthesis
LSLFSILEKDNLSVGLINSTDLKALNLDKNVSILLGKNHSKRCLIKKKIKQIADYLGFSPIILSYSITPKLDDWLESYKPDVIYTFLNQYEYFHIVMSLHEKYGLPIIVHPMDDHIKIMPPKGLMYLYWKRKMQMDFIKLINKASLRLGISDYMNETYYKRYGLSFKPYHNPVETDLWLPYAKTNWAYHKNFKILYVGRYGYDNAELLNNLAFVVDRLNNEGYSIKLNLLFGNLSALNLKNSFNNFENTQILEPVPHERIKLILPKYDLLYYPLGFDKKTRKIFSVSMSTKISEYMISGTPILVQAPENTAYYKYAKDNNIAFALKTNNIIDLKSALLQLIQNEHLRKAIGTQAQSVAVKTLDAKVVRENLRMDFMKAMKNDIK